jgi:hypothetical protein
MDETALSIHQCPFCELRFADVNEMRDHVVTDHPSHADAFARAAPHEGQRPAPH